ncbi:hypothetical protein ANN_05903 [Periplaneta americana]|uniref:Uncharacterized protein n=1 Tax=Periplaneta americana TaxID=6978 RepID=A0ABQ8TC74_PERAM|nr:hypothetical protein ANN_05903 [Periplaneta americana]
MSNARLIPFEDLSLVTILPIMHVRYLSDYAVNYLALERKRPTQTSDADALIVSDKVRNHRYNTTARLRATVENAFNEVNLDYLHKTSARTWRRIQLCCENEGLHKDVLDR